MDEQQIKRYVWRLKSYKGESATVIYYPWLMQWEAISPSDRLFKRLYRYLPAKPRNYGIFKSKMSGSALYARLGLRILNFHILD